MSDLDRACKEAQAALPSVAESMLTHALAGARANVEAQTSHEEAANTHRLPWAKVPHGTPLTSTQAQARFKDWSAGAFHIGVTTAALNGVRIVPTPKYLVNGVPMRAKIFYARADAPRELRGKRWQQDVQTYHIVIPRLSAIMRAMVDNTLASQHLLDAYTDKFQTCVATALNRLTADNMYNRTSCVMYSFPVAPTACPGVAQAVFHSDDVHALAIEDRNTCELTSTCVLLMQYMIIPEYYYHEHATLQVTGSDDI